MEMRLSATMRRHAKMLDFGTAFDHGGEKSALAYYESKIAAGEILTDNDMLACNNRRFLFGIMTQAGFQPYFAEWWHFNAPESQMGAATAGLDYATVGAVGLDESNIAHENTRLKIRQEALKLQREGDLAVARTAGPAVARTAGLAVARTAGLAVVRTAGLAVARTALQVEILAAIRETGDPKLVEDWPAEIIAPPEE
jgi:hypothetical protein